jgi:hypothetical protein
MVSRELSDSNFLEEIAGSFCDRERLIKGRRIHVLLDDALAPEADLFDSIAQGYEVHGTFSRFNIPSHGFPE